MHYHYECSTLLAKTVNPVISRFILVNIIISHCVYYNIYLYIFIWFEGKHYISNSISHVKEFCVKRLLFSHDDSLIYRVHFNSQHKDRVSWNQWIGMASASSHSVLNNDQVDVICYREHMSLSGHKRLF